MTRQSSNHLRPFQKHVLDSRLKLTLVVGCIITFVSLAAYTSPLQSVFAQTDDLPIPVLTYYYIWFDTSSWDRAKVDYPLLGRYSSDDAAVMLQHIQWAKHAGIDGFIVSSNNTEKLNPRLKQLVELANQEVFKLAIIYEGLDFYRDPLPADRIADDLDFFIAHYTENAAFNLFEKPVVIWSGIWEFSLEEVQLVIEERREHLLILASEKNVEDYQRLANLVDGNAYYWSSVNPETHPGYQEKLRAMGASVHEDGGIWIAPAAPGFDARLVGGTTVIERREGQTLQAELTAAYRSAPDAIGLISWNEFSENSHIEPSLTYGNYYLTVLADILHVSAPVLTDFDSSKSGIVQNDYSGGAGRIAALSVLTILILGSLWVVFKRDVDS